MLALLVYASTTFSQSSLSAKNDFFSTAPIHPATGGTTNSVLANDTVNAIPNSASLSNVTLSWLSSAPSGFTLNSTGTITIAPGTASGNYLINYRICGSVNTSLCDTAYATVYVDKDSDADGITDRNDADDDNDGILDATECNIDLLSVYHPSNTTNSNLFLLIRPSDFGFTTPGARNLNGSHDYSSFFGLPVGSIIITVEGANVHPTADEFYVSQVAGASSRTSIKVTGTVGVYTAAEHGRQYIGRVERGISFMDGTTPATGLFDMGTQTTGGNWVAGNVDQYYYVRHTATSTENAGLFYANINSQVMPKHVEFSTTNRVTTEYSTFFFRIFPECDFDKDGRPNRLDLDSDNDDCVDALEGGGGHTASQLGTAGGTVTTGSLAANRNFCAANGCVNASGVPSTAGASGQTAGSAYNAGAISTNCISILADESFAFDAVIAGNTIVLKWNAPPKPGNKGFEVERSSDSKNWKTIGLVNGNISANNNAKTVHHFTDHTPLTGKNYYRIKQLDHDGSYVYSEVRNGQLGYNTNINVYPNPAQQHINISGLNKNETIELYDMTGRKIQSIKNNTTRAMVYVDHLIEGMYRVQVIGQDGVRKAGSFLKVR